MSASTRVFYERQETRPPNTIQKTTRFVRNHYKALAITSGLVVASLPNGPIDMWGDFPRDFNTNEKIDKFNHNWTVATRFRMQFIGQPFQQVDGKGIFSIDNSGNNIAGDDCLEGSAYDITPSELRGRTNGDVSAVAAITAINDTVTVYPVSEGAGPLNFTITDLGILSPTDESTLGTIKAYGCGLEFLPGAMMVTSSK